jgi:hypothetical protein
VTSWERLLLASLIALLFIIAARLFNRAGRWRVSTHYHGKDPGDDLVPGSPTLLYFWSTGCAQCTVQELQIREAEKTLADLGRSIRVSKHDAASEVELSSRMHVLTVPTTVLVRGDGSIAAWNPGLTRSRTLASQISGVFERPG